METKPSFVATLFAILIALFALSPVFANNVVTADDDQGARSEAIEQSITSRPEDHHYFTIAPDPRLCPSPLCGGYWVTRVNRPFTVCADGRQAARCYVADLDFSLSGFSPAQQNMARGATGHALMRGFIEPKQFGAFGNLGTFSVREAWIGHRGIVASGTFYRARNTGIVCIAFPCPSYQVARLNRNTRPQRIAGVNLRNVSADPSDGYAQLNADDGVMTAGDLTPVSGPAG